MQIEQFLEQVAILPKEFKPVITWDSRIRFLVRDINMLLCPLEAVNYHVTGIISNLGDNFGLSSKDRYNIIIAADFTVIQPQLREQLKRSMGL